VSKHRRLVAERRRINVEEARAMAAATLVLEPGEFTFRATRMLFCHQRDRPPTDEEIIAEAQLWVDDAATHADSRAIAARAILGERSAMNYIRSSAFVWAEVAPDGRPSK